MFAKIEYGGCPEDDKLAHCLEIIYTVQSVLACGALVHM